jgi:hypothetical protein
MDDFLIEQIEWLLSGNLNRNRLTRTLLILVGSLGGETPPETITTQMNALSRQLVLQDLFDSLTGLLNTLAQNNPAKHGAVIATPTGNPEIAALLVQIEDTRRQISECENVNYAQLIAWVVARAKERKLWSGGRGRR